jgi:hypothetical protein
MTGVRSAIRELFKEATCLRFMGAGRCLDAPARRGRRRILSRGTMTEPRALITGIQGFCGTWRSTCSSGLCPRRHRSAPGRLGFLPMTGRGA